MKKDERFEEVLDGVVRDYSEALGNLKEIEHEDNRRAILEQVINLYSELRNNNINADQVIETENKIKQLMGDYYNLIGGIA